MTVCDECNEPIGNIIFKGKFCSAACMMKDLGRSIRAKHIEKYLQSPRLCAHCKNIIPWRMDRYHLKATCCCQKCSRAFMQVSSEKIDERTFKIIEKQKATSLKMFHAGELRTNASVRRILIMLGGHQCSRCKRTEWNLKPIPLEVDHIDGNSQNNNPENLRMLCVTCHAQMPTSRGKNRGKGRNVLKKRKLLSCI